MDVSRNDMLGELANDAALERTDFVVQATEQLAKFLDRQPRADQPARRADAHRRRPGLPLGRPGPHVPRPQPVRGPGHRRVGLGHRDRRDAPRSWSSSTTRPRSTRPSPRPRARRPGLSPRADRHGRPPGRPPASRPRRRSGSVIDGRVRRRRRRVGRRPAAGRWTRTTRSRPRSRCTTSRSTSRSGASRARPASSTSSRRPSRGLPGSSAT